MGTVRACVIGLGHTVELKHSPDSEQGLLFSEAGKTSPKSSEAEISPIQKKKRKEKNYFFCKMSSSP